MSSCFVISPNVKSLSHVQLFASPWTVAYQAPLFVEFSRQEYWSGLPFSSPGDLPTQGWNPGLLHCRQTLYRLSHQGSPHFPSQDPVSHAISLVLTLLKGHMLPHYCNLPGIVMTSTQYMQKQNRIRMLRDSFCPAIAKS